MQITTKQYNSMVEKLDAMNESIVALKAEPLKIDVTHVAPDFFMAGVTLFATFLGAIFAYQVNAFGEWLKYRNQKIDKVNYAFNSLVLNLNMLLNFKRQFLFRRNELVQTIADFAGSFIEATPEALAQRSTVFLPALRTLRDEKIDEVFVKWDELEFPKFFDHEGLIFMIDYRPDDLRVFDVIRDQLQVINRSIVLRNNLWPKFTDVLMKGFPPDIQAMGILYEFLVFRRNVKEAADLAICAIIESLERLAEYQEAKFTAPKIFGIRFAPKFRTMKWSIPPAFAELIPDKSKYETVLKRPPGKR